MLGCLLGQLAAAVAAKVRFWRIRRTALDTEVACYSAGYVLIWHGGNGRGYHRRTHSRRNSLRFGWLAYFFLETGGHLLRPLAEFVNRPTNAPPHFRQLLRSKNEKCYHDDDHDMDGLDSEWHSASFVMKQGFQGILVKAYLDPLDQAHSETL